MLLGKPDLNYVNSTLHYHRSTRATHQTRLAIQLGRLKLGRFQLKIEYRNITIIEISTLLSQTIKIGHYKSISIEIMPYNKKIIAQKNEQANVRNIFFYANIFYPRHYRNFLLYHLEVICQKNRLVYRKIIYVRKYFLIT